MLRHYSRVRGIVNSTKITNALNRLVLLSGGSEKSKQDNLGPPVISDRKQDFYWRRVPQEIHILWDVP